MSLKGEYAMRMEKRTGDESLCTCCERHRHSLKDWLTWVAIGYALLSMVGNAIEWGTTGL